MGLNTGQLTALPGLRQGFFFISFEYDQKVRYADVAFDPLNVVFVQPDPEKKPASL
jgi:hypothetical protein